ncbi:MAG: tetratricopeptide repeat protein, partial [Desulfocapsaceae bacterium]
MVFGHKLEKIILATIPTSKEVAFVSRENLKSIKCELSKNKKRQALDKVFKNNVPVWLKPDKLLLPLDCADDTDLAILVDGVDDLLIEKASSQWLDETQSAISRQFIEARSDFIDPLTSLFNVNSLRDYLARIALEEVHLVLVESLPPAKSVKEAFLHTADSGRILEEFNRLSFPLFHLGQSVFCCVVARREKDFIKSMCHSLSNFARNRGLRRLHIGFSSFSKKRHQNVSSDRLAQTFIDEAWKALQWAGRRGPYSFCDYQLLVNPELFPLKAISRNTIGKLSYRWKDIKKFSLVYLKPDFHDRKTFDVFMTKYLDKEIVVNDDHGYFVLRQGKNAGNTEKWASLLIKKVIKAEGERYSLSAGISSYPFRDYKRPEIARNCMKALLHGTFFGPGSCVVFDALSLNVSGDAYFGESDLSGAVKEYRKGLEIAPHDVNLLNSLGVAYALMNMSGKAFDIFNQVLEVDPKNFMALFNRGLGEKKQNNYNQAVKSFTRALDVFNREDDEETASISELQFQLGVCQFSIGEYRKCIKVLNKWHSSQKNERGIERCLRFIGISYYHLGDFKQSAKWLQRALVVNQSDSEALSLLGTVYLKT